MAYNDPGGAGIGGWLAFFMIILVVLMPLGSIVGVATQLYGDPQLALAYGSTWAALQLFEWALVAVAIAGCLCLAWLLNYRQHWRTIRIVIPAIWLIWLGTLVADFIGVSLITGLPISVLLDEGRLEFIRPVLFSGLWTAYFLRSERVANTYPRELEARDVAGVFE